MKPESRQCPRCASARTKRNGTRVRAQVQQYLCRECGHQWAESRDALIAMLRSFEIDARRQGILQAVALFVRGRSMRSVERQTGIKSETLKKYLEILRRPQFWDHLDSLLKARARVSASCLANLHNFWAEFGMTKNPYFARGQDLNRAREYERRNASKRGSGPQKKR